MRDCHILRRSILCIIGLRPYPSLSLAQAEAEQIVIQANGQEGLLTCAIRPSGIFGPNDSQVCTGMMKAYYAGQSGIQIGSNENLSDYTHVDNVVHAHILAADKLGESVSLSVFDVRIPWVTKSVGRRVLPTSNYRPATVAPGSEDNVSDQASSDDYTLVNDEKQPTDEPPLPAVRNRFDQFFPLNFYGPDGNPPDEIPSIPVAGQTFFITNGEPIYFWDFSVALFKAYSGYVAKRPVVIPEALSWPVAALAETAAYFKGAPGGLTRDSVKYMTMPRYYNIEKARRILGYEPVIGIEEGINKSAEWYRERDIKAGTFKQY